MAEQHSQTADYENRYKFTGHELDRETGLYYAGARYYDPKISIWLSVDPLLEKFPNWNPYNYVMQNPINLIDPTGMCPDESQSTGEPPTAAEVYRALLNLLPTEQRENVEKAVNTLKESVKDFDLAKLAIGVENTVGFESSAGVKTEGNAISGNVVFLGGEDAGYVYSYYGGETGLGGETSLSTGVNIGTSVYVAYNYSGHGGHKSFDGDYSYYRGSLGVDTGLITNIVGVNAGAGFSGTYAVGKDWKLFSVSGSIGVSAGFSTSITGSYTQGQGNVKFSSGQNVGGSKSYFNTISSYLKLLSPFN
jgi:RHS repeat-associated protein